MSHVSVPPRRVGWLRWCARSLGAPALLLLVMPAASARAAGWSQAGTAVTPAPGALVHAGEWVRTRWTPLPAEVDEFELLLILAGDDAPRIRLTGQLAPGQQSYVWRVPNLPCAAARLVVRYSRGHGEEEATPGEPFRIVGAAAAPAASLSFVGGEWWVATGGGAWPVRLPSREGSVQAVAPAEARAEVALAGEGWAGHGEHLHAISRELLAVASLPPSGTPGLQPRARMPAARPKRE